MRVGLIGFSQLLHNVGKIIRAPRAAAVIAPLQRPLLLLLKKQPHDCPFFHGGCSYSAPSIVSAAYRHRAGATEYAISALRTPLPKGATDISIETVIPNDAPRTSHLRTSAFTLKQLGALYPMQLRGVQGNAGYLSACAMTKSSPAHGCA